MKQRVIDWWANPENKEKVWNAVAWAAWMDIATSGAAIVALVLAYKDAYFVPNGFQADLTVTEAIMMIVTDWTNYGFLAIWVALYFCTGSPRILPWRK